MTQEIINKVNKNLVEILKHYPRETELYSPLYGKLWLAEVDEEREIITCYKHPLDEGCTRAILEQEDTVSFYSNGTTGLPDFSISKDCMLFLYDIKKQGEQKSIEVRTTGYWNVQDIERKFSWSEEDEKMLNDILICGEHHCYLDAGNIAWLKSIKDRVQPQNSNITDEEPFASKDAYNDSELLVLVRSFPGVHFREDNHNWITIREDILVQVIEKIIKGEKVSFI